jgi:hypothetical protein
VEDESIFVISRAVEFESWFRFQNDVWCLSSEPGTATAAKEFRVESHLPFATPDCRHVILPKGVWQSSQTIYGDALRYQKKDRYFDNDQFLSDSRRATVSFIE